MATKQLTTSGATLPCQEGKTCSRCREELPLDSFILKSRDGHVRRADCRACVTRQATLRARKVVGFDSRGRKITLASLKHAKQKFGLTSAQYVALLDSTDNCAICQKRFDPKLREPSIDHCHKTGMIRGLLCAKCNPLLGMARDDGEILRRAAEYLEDISPPILRVLERVAADELAKLATARKDAMKTWERQALAVIDAEQLVGNAGATAAKIRMETGRRPNKMWGTKRMETVLLRLINAGIVERVSFQIIINPKANPCQKVVGYRRRKAS